MDTSEHLKNEDRARGLPAGRLRLQCVIYENHSIHVNM